MIFYCIAFSWVGWTYCHVQELCDITWSIHQKMNWGYVRLWSIVCLESTPTSLHHHQVMKIIPSDCCSTNWDSSEQATLLQSSDFGYFCQCFPVFSWHEWQLCGLLLLETTCIKGQCVWCPEMYRDDQWVYIPSLTICMTASLPTRQLYYQCQTHEP